MPELSLKLGAQFTAACVAMEGCALLASRLPQHANTTFRLASALALVFGAGPAFLRQCAVPWPGMGLDPAQFLIEANHQLGAAAAVLHCASASWHQPAAAEAFVRTAGRPQAVMPWLLAVSQAVLTLPADMQGTISSIRDGSRTSAREVVTNTLRNYAIAANLLLNISSEAFPDAMQQVPATQQAVLSVLLDRCLPLLAADASPETLGDASHTHYALAGSLCYAVGCRSLWSELARKLEQPQGAAYICQALRVMAALPLHPTSAATRAGSFGEQHAGSILLLGRLCACSPQNGQPDAALAAAAWLFVESLPHFAAVLAALAADCGIPAQLQARICSSFMAASTTLSQHLPPMSSDSQLAAWAAASEAALRLAPALLQLHERCQALDEEPVRATPALLSQHLVALLSEASQAGNHVQAQFSGPQPPAADERLTRQLWALHTRVCRLLQWLLADSQGARRTLLCDPGAVSICHLLECFSHLRFAVLAHMTCAVDAGVLSDDCELGVCAAHWAAIQAAVPAAGGLAGCTPVLHHLAVDLDAINSWSGHLIPDDSLAAMFSGAIALLAPKLSQYPAAEEAVQVAASSSETLAVALARSAALQGLLEEARRLKRARNTAARLPRGVVLRHRLLARRLAGGRAPPHVPGAGRGAAGGQGGGGGGSGSC